MVVKKVLLIGDSITEWGRHEDPENLGSGYVRLIHDYFVTTYPNQAYQFLNRGVGGDRIIDLAERWQKDAIDLNPDYISISIGINDVWRQLDHADMEQIGTEQFQQLYIDLLTQVREKTNARIILMEPTIIEEDVKAKGNQLLFDYVEIVHKVAKEFHATVVPTHKAFINYLQSGNDYKLTTDGVHMNPAGNMLMASTWIKAVEDQLK
ncbi:SGNH/GDSL hydrolase family protein [Metabacillus bambusae]|uniref:SGNH/GDSL hydrolase family protein n=1 Tax=Metabacillus bambusae TaxID=2795218 RepID=A0ABS3MY91_9BACI|nr:SGNH/GDSL hydrolase family protein [Metabacillus bambusae]MBO1510974.1 SGNH/GDSL hydrolase family protein [Metabacillus bambusae]